MKNKKKSANEFKSIICHPHDITVVRTILLPSESKNKKKNKSLFHSNKPPILIKFKRQTKVSSANVPAFQLTGKNNEAYQTR
jgi:hypothetical protein